MESVGGCSGYYFPEMQPAKDLIVISKFGDYDGRLFIIDNKGEVKHYIGGKFYVSADNKYLFSNYDSDLSGVTIMDLTKNEVVYTGELNRYIADWYYQDGDYFALISEDVVVNKEVKKLLFNFQTKTFTEIKSEKPVDSRNKLRLYNDVVNARDCYCGR